MVTPSLSFSDAGLIVLTALALWIPGGVVLWASSARGWWLAASAPLATYGLAGLGGPLLSGIGLPWRIWSFAILATVVALAVLGVRLLRSPRGRDEVHWTSAAHISVAASAAIAFGIGLFAVLVGIKDLTAVPQDWDAVFHANGIRWILETGDGGLNGMSQVNWYGTDTAQYYPNSYHLIAALVTATSGRDIPSVLNSFTALTPGIAALGLAALVRLSGGRAITAGASAVVVVGISAFYDMLWRGPLLPFSMGVALVPALLVSLDQYLQPGRLKDQLPHAIILALMAVGLFGLHPGALIAAALFAVALVLSRWLTRRGRLGSDILALAVGGAFALVLVTPHVLGSLRNVAEASNDWPAVTTTANALGEALLFSTDAPSLQVWLALLFSIGLLTALRLGPLRWLLVPAGAFLLMYVLAASSDAPVVEALTRPWWNDRYRLIGIAALPVAIVVGHGIAESTDLARRLITPIATRLSPRRSARFLPGFVAAAVLGTYVLVSGGSYLGRNEVRMQNNTGDGPAVSRAELMGFQVLRRLVPNGERVMNDRGDGSAWMYAMAGVRPVAGHYYGGGVDSDATLLAERFNSYDSDPVVREAAARLGVGWVVVDRGFLRPGALRQPGLEDLDRVAALRVAYSNPDVTVYQLNTR